MQGSIASRGRGVFVFTSVLLGFNMTVPCHGQQEPQAVLVEALAIAAPAKDKDGKPKAPAFIKDLINVELSFIKRVADPTDQQMDAIVKAATKALGDMGDIVRDPNNRVVRANQVNVMGPNGQQLTENPYPRIRKEALEYTKSVLDKSQYQRYESESKSRAEYERDAVIRIAIGIIDDKVVLSDEQRDKLDEKLSTSWKPMDIQQMQTYLHNPQYVPSLPRGLMTGILTRSQLNAWTTANATTMYINIGVQTNNGLGEEWIK